MKIKTVCEKTGLTDRTIRFYIEEGLISPSFTENYLGRKAFDFSEKDILKLCDIAILRNFDFSIEEIRQILRTPENSFAIIKTVRDRIGGELSANQKKLSALSSLVERSYTLSELAKALSKPDENLYTEEEIQPNIGRRITLGIKTVIFFLAVWLPLVISATVCSILLIGYKHPILSPLFLVLTLLCLMPSLFSILSSGIPFFRKTLAKRALFYFCLACIPLSAFASFSAVKECKHSWVEIAVEREASCSQEGKVVKKCDLCHVTISETQKKNPHTVVTDQAIEATCTYEGLSEGAHCSVCQTVLQKQNVIPKKSHTYVKTEVTPTCNQEGYTLFTCSCGYAYQDNTVAATEKHDFKKNAANGFICSQCALEVCEYGFVDGSSTGGEQKMRYYITGRADAVNELERTLVIYGTGAMPDPLYQPYHPWRNSVYVEEIKTVVICEGVISIAKEAFVGSIAEDTFFGNPFHSVEYFIVKDATLTIDPKDPSISGIACDITYIR